MCRYTLSDGVASVKAIVSETVHSKMPEKPKRFDVIRVSSLKKIEIKNKNADQEPQWLINLTAPAEVLMTNLTATLGTPQEINSIKKGEVDFDKTIEISQFDLGGKPEQ